MNNILIANLFPRETRPYYIWAPSYTYKSSGVRNLHLLCHLLNTMGYKAYLYPDRSNYATNPFLDTPVITGEVENWVAQNDVEPIFIYPDIVKGNPFNAKHVVRLLLAPAGAYGGDAAFPETDMIYGALPSIAKKTLRMPLSDPNIFYDKDEKREGACFYSHKYDMIHGNQLLSITDGAKRLEGRLTEISDILRKSEVCYLYEVSSILTEAALCGCPVVLVRTDYFNKIDPECMMGDVKWSDGEVVKECKDYKYEYNQICANFWVEFQQFIVDTQGM